MTKTYHIHQYLKSIEHCEVRSYKSYAHEHSNKRTRSEANPRQYHYLSYVEDILKNYDTNDQITIHSSGQYGIRRNGAEVGYGRIDHHLVNNPCYPKYTQIL